MECIYCKGEMVKGAAPLSINRRGYHIHWAAVPAWVCSQCGEIYFESREADLIQKALATLEAETATLLGQA